MPGEADEREQFDPELRQGTVGVVFVGPRQRPGQVGGQVDRPRAVTVGQPDRLLVHPHGPGGAGDGGDSGRHAPGSGRLLEEDPAARRHGELQVEGVVGHGGRSVGDHRQAGPDLAGVAQPGADLVEGVDTGGAEPAAEDLLVEPPVRHRELGVRHIRQPADEGGQPGVADGAVGQEPGAEDVGGGEPELVGDQVDEAGPLGQGQQLAGLGGVHGEGLLDQQVAAGGDGLAGQRGVGGRRGGDADGVQAEVQGVGERGGGHGHPAGGGPLGRPLGVLADQGHHVEAGGPQRRHVGPAAEPGADHGHPQSLAGFHSVVSSPVAGHPRYPSSTGPPP